MERSVYSFIRKDTSDRHEVPEDTIFRLLSSGRRRALLRALEEADGEASLSNLTEAVAHAEGLEDEGSSRPFKKVYVSLYQTHVPAMVEAGVLEHDTEAKTVALTPQATPLLRYLHFDPAKDRGGPLSRLLTSEGSHGVS